jgi:hypothetical protein
VLRHCRWSRWSRRSRRSRRSRWSRRQHRGLVQPLCQYQFQYKEKGQYEEALEYQYLHQYLLRCLWKQRQ